MNIFRVCFATVSAAVAAAGADSSGRECMISTPLAYLSSQGYCDLDGEVSGVVLLSKRSALSKALFKQEGLEADRLSSASKTKVLQAQAGHASTAHAASANTWSVLLEPFTLLSISRLHTIKGGGRILLLVVLVCIVAIAGVSWYLQAERRKHEIYDLPDSEQEEGGEIWLKGRHGHLHRPVNASDSHAYRSPQPSARSLEEPVRGSHQKLRGSPPGTGSSLGSGRIETDTKLQVKESSAEALMHRKEEKVMKLLRKREHEAEAAANAALQQTEEALIRVKTMRSRALKTGGDAVLEVGKDIHGIGKGASKKLVNTIDKVTGQAITNIRDRMEDKAAMLEQRWNEARSSNLR